MQQVPDDVQSPPGHAVPAIADAWVQPDPPHESVVQGLPSSHPVGTQLPAQHI